MVGYYIMFNGNCAEALDVYTRAFNGQILEKQTYGDMPPNPAFPVKAEDKDHVLHARLSIGGDEIMCADSSERIEPGDNMYISIMTTDAELMHRAWDVLKEQGEVFMEPEPSFFAAEHGSLRDRFGVNWMFTVTRQ